MKILVAGIFISLLLLLPMVSNAYTLVSHGLNTSSYTASSSWNGWTPDLAFDGNWNNMWNAGTFAGTGYNSFPWIEVDLGVAREISQIVLGVEQDPLSSKYRTTRHVIRSSLSSMGNDLSTTACAAILNGTYMGDEVFTYIGGYTSDGQHIQADFSTPMTARYIQVRSLSSYSWIAWNEIQILSDEVELPAADLAATPAPEPGTALLMTAGAIGLGCCGFRKRSRCQAGNFQ